MSDNAMRAIRLIEDLEDLGAGDKFEQAKSFIKDKGIVKRSFLQRLQKEKAKYTEEM